RKKAPTPLRSGEAKTVGGCGAENRNAEIEGCNKNGSLPSRGKNLLPGISSLSCRKYGGRLPQPINRSQPKQGEAASQAPGEARSVIRQIWQQRMEQQRNAGQDC